MKKVTSLLMALILSVTILMGSIPMNASAAMTRKSTNSTLTKTEY